MSGWGAWRQSHSIANPPEIASTMSRPGLLSPSARTICRGIMASYPPMFGSRRRLDAPQGFRLAGRLGFLSATPATGESADLDHLERHPESRPWLTSAYCERPSRPSRRLWRRPAAVDIAPKVGDDQDARVPISATAWSSGAAATARARSRHSSGRWRWIPDFADAVMARAEILDGMGRSEEAHGEYERARRLWSETAAGRRRPALHLPPPGILRLRGRDRTTWSAPTSAARSCRSSRTAMRLARGRAAEALDSYERALKVNAKLAEVLALKGEALSALGRYQESDRDLRRRAGHPSEGWRHAERPRHRARGAGPAGRSQRRLAPPVRTSAADQLGGARLRGDAHGQLQRRVQRVRAGHRQGARATPIGCSIG